MEDKLRREHGIRYDQELFERHVTGYSLRPERYRLTLWVDRRRPEDEPFATELYHRAKDPLELRNVAPLSQNHSLVAELRARCLAAP